MKGYVNIYHKKAGFSHEEDDIKSLAALYFNMDVNVKSYQSDKISSFVFTNEPDYEMLRMNNDKKFIVSYSGYILKDDQEIYEDLFMNLSDSYVTSLSGVFSLNCVDLHKNRITVWNNITGVEPVFWSETSDRIVVGNKAVLVHLLANKLNKPEYATENVISFLNNGYFLSRSTPFKNTHVLPINSKLSINNGSLRITEIDDLNENLYTLEPTPERLDDITDSFIQSFSGLKDFKGDITIGLTGGKDSRLIVSGLNSIGVNFTAGTNGFMDSPDVVVAKQISEALTIPHEIHTPAKKDAKSMNKNLMNRIQTVIKSSEGMLYGYENATLPNAYNSSLMKLGGQGGELLRGGFARNSSIYDMDKFRKLIKNRFAKYSKFFQEGTVASYNNYLLDYIDSQPKHMKPKDILNKIFLEFRTGRWSAASRPIYSMNYFFYTPFFDSKLIRKVQLLNSETASFDHLIYEIIKRTSPELLDIPFAKDRWAFEYENPRHHKDVYNWARKKPVYPETVVSGFNWRQNVLTNLKEEFYEGIFFDENSPVFDYVNKNSVKQLFNGNVKRPADYDKFLWALYTVNIMLTNKWITNEIEGQSSKIIIPKQEETANANILREIRVLPMDLLNAKSRKIKLHNLSDTQVELKVNSNRKMRKLYLQLFKGSFKKAPSKVYKDNATIEDFHSFEIIFEVTKEDENALDLTCFVMQYDGETKVNTTKKQVKISQNSQFVKLKVDKQRKADQFKLAVKLVKGNVPLKFTINQLRLQGYK